MVRSVGKHVAKSVPADELLKEGMCATALIS